MLWAQYYSPDPVRICLPLFRARLKPRSFMDSLGGRDCFGEGQKRRQERRKMERDTQSTTIYQERHLEYRYKLTLQGEHKLKFPILLQAYKNC